MPFSIGRVAQNAAEFTSGFGHASGAAAYGVVRRPGAPANLADSPERQKIADSIAGLKNADGHPSLIGGVNNTLHAQGIPLDAKSAHELTKVIKQHGNTTGIEGFKHSRLGEAKIFSNAMKTSVVKNNYTGAGHAAAGVVLNGSSGLAASGVHSAMSAYKPPTQSTLDAINHLSA